MGPLTMLISQLPSFPHKVLPLRFSQIAILERDTACYSIAWDAARFIQAINYCKIKE